MNIIVTGANGYAGTFFSWYLLAEGHRVISLTRRSHPFLSGRSAFKELSIEGDELPEQLLREKPAAAVHLAALSSPQQCQHAPEEAVKCNVALTKKMALLASRLNFFLCTVSTDLVFDGALNIGQGFTEADAPRPLSVYAATKRQGEIETLQLEHAAVVRSCLIFGPRFSIFDRRPFMENERTSFLSWIEDNLRQGKESVLFNDEWRTPVYVFDLCKALAAVCRRRLSGIFHCAGPQRLSRCDFGMLYAREFGLPTNLIVSASRLSLEASPARPEDVSLNCSKLAAALEWRPLSLTEAFSDIRKQTEGSVP